MPDYLSSKDWRSVLDKKEHKSVKKTGVSETLEDFAAAKKKDDLGKMVSALQRIIEKAEEVKSAQSKFPLLTTFLAETVKAAKVEQQKLAPRLAEIANKEDEDNEDSTLGKALAKVRQLGPENAWNFVLAPGKPSSGLVVTKKTLKKDDTEKAFQMKGKRGPFFTGRIHGENGKFVLDLGPEQQPVPGMAKAAKNAALLHAEMNIKILVRGAGSELDSDSDIEPMEEGGGTTGSAPVTNQGHIATFNTRIEQVRRAIATFLRSPNAKVDGAADGLYGALKILREQIAGDSQMTENTKRDMLVGVDGLQVILDEALAPAPEDPGTNYPDDSYWKNLAEGIMRLDPSKQMEAWKRFRARGLQVEQQFNEDQTLVDPARSRVWQTIERALSMANSAISRAGQMNEQRDKAPELSRLFLNMERKYDLIRSTPGLDPGQVKQIETIFGAFRNSFRNGTLNPNDPKIAQIQQALNTMQGRALAMRQGMARIEGQKQMHFALKPAMAFLKKAAQPTNMIKDPEMIRSRVKTDPDLRGLVESMSLGMKTPGIESAKGMEAAARKVMEALAKKRKEGNAPFDKADSQVEEMALDVLRRAQAMRLTAEYEALGNPPWDPGQADLASELQAQLFFLEGSIAQGKPTYEAPRLASEEGGGASGSWWIERPEPGQGQEGKPGAKKKYIFKPGVVEGVAFNGMPPGSGAPREVLAKRLDEMMSGAGFSVGVSPTTLASIDTTQLGGLNPTNPKHPNPGGPKSGPQLGSMQQLAPSNGALGDKLRGQGSKELVQSIDKRSFDDIAVFDMVFANLDRHSNNLLVQTDPLTGTNKLVPIDHGSSLPDPEVLQLNRKSILGSGNIFTGGALPQSDEPLGDEALEALARLDPDKMVEDMKRARNDMSERHPGAEGTVSDAAIEAMGARVRFLKLAAGTVPVKEIFQMLGLGALRIAQARPEDLPDLIETLRAEVADLAEAQKEIATTVESLTSAGDGSTSNSISTQLLQLGWAWGVDAKNLDEWIIANPKLVTRVLKGRIVNPKVDREIQRLLPLARQINPNIDRTLANKNPGERATELLKVVNGARMKGPANDSALEDLQQAFVRLGGEAELKRAAAVFPQDFEDALKPPQKEDPEDVRFGWIDRVRLMEQWAVFQEKGGTRELARLGIAMPRETSIERAVWMLDSTTLCGDAAQEVLELDEEEVEQQAVEGYNTLSQLLSDFVGRIRNESEKRKAEMILKAAQKDWQAGKHAGAITILGKYVASFDSWIASEEKFIRETEAAEQKMEQDFNQLEEDVKQTLQPFMAGIRDALAEAKETCFSKTREDALNEFATRIDVARKGEESLYRKQGAQVRQLEQRMAEHANLPWHGAIDSRLIPVRAYLTAFNPGDNLRQQIEIMSREIGVLDVLKEALGNADLGNLPGPVTVILQDWTQRMAKQTNMSRPEGDAQKIRDLLNPPQD